MNMVAVKADNEIVTYDPNFVRTIRNSIFPGAKEESVIFAIDYCRHAKMDIMLKPVHIVPMWIVDKETGKGEMRDVIMHGINHYRIQAARSGCAGISEPEFGEEITECLGGVDITYPKWCKMTAKRIISGKEVEFTVKEFWKENYANSGKDKATGRVKESANAMWQKRPFGQLAKCTEAQVLRKAFPEIGAMPTAEEMEGKTLDHEEYEEIKKAYNAKGIKAVKEKLGMPIDSTTGEVLDGEFISESETVEQFTTEETQPSPLSGESTAYDFQTRITNAKSLDDLKGVIENVEHLPGGAKAIIKKLYAEKEKLLSN